MPWIAYDSYFKMSCPHDDIAHEGQLLTRAQVLSFNRHSFGYFSQYVEVRERTAVDCFSDPLFTQLPVISAKRRELSPILGDGLKDQAAAVWA